MAQAPEAVVLWESFLNKVGFSRIIEFGTYKWGMSVFFQLYCIQKKAEFYTYDNKWYHLCHLGRALGTKKHFTEVDIFSIEKEIGEIIAREGTTIVYCDNGDKPRELAVFSKYLKKGDFIVTHDYGTEVLETDIPKGLTRIWLEYSDGMTAIFQYA